VPIDVNDIPRPVEFSGITFSSFFGLPNFGLVFYHGAKYVLGIAQAEMAIMRN
jgi:hypothetical protein